MMKFSVLNSFLMTNLEIARKTTDKVIVNQFCINIYKRDVFIIIIFFFSLY